MPVTITKNLGSSPLGEVIPPPMPESGDLLSKTPISELWKKLENIETEKDALELLGVMFKYDSRVRFLIGGILQVVKEKGLYTPYTFGSWCNTYLGYAPRQAQYYMQLFNNYPSNTLPLEHYLSLSITKWRCIFDAAISVEDYSEWIEAAKKLTVEELKTQLKGQSTAENDVIADEIPATKDALEKVTFYASTDELEVIKAGIELCKEKANMNSAGKCLSLICSDYLAGSGDVGEMKVPTVKDLCNREIKKHAGNKQKALAEIIDQISTAFPEAIISVPEVE